MGSFWQSVKIAFAEFINLLRGEDYERSEDSILNMLSGKAAAISVGVLGFALLLVPVQSPQIMHVGDSLIRTSVTMWNGS